MPFLPKKPLSISYTQIQAAAKNLEQEAHCTPVLTSRTVNQLSQSQVFFKCENFQRTGSFKFRGAYNALSQLSNLQKQQGVIAYSSGNHAQGVALASQLLGISATIVMPQNAAVIKQTATREYGAKVILYDPQAMSREEIAQNLAQENHLTTIPPYDHYDIIAGQGTVAKELIEQTGSLDLLLVPCGGGGLLSGCAVTTKTLLPKCCVIGVEPEQANDATLSFYSSSLHKIQNPDTIADGARTPSLGQLTFPLVLRYVDDMITVSEEAITRAMKFLWERLKIVVEPTGALTIAALLEGVIPVQGKRVGVILSGGNVDFRNGDQFNTLS
jgi:threonine dehydratase